MTFDLLPTVAPFAWAFVTLAVLAAVVGLASLGTTVPRTRRIRLARHESVRTYYGRLVLGH